MARRPTCLTFLPDQHKPLLREWLFLYPRFSFICGFCGACWHLSQNRLFSSKRHNRLLIRQYNPFSSFLTPSSSHQLSSASDSAGLPNPSLPDRPESFAPHTSRISLLPHPRRRARGSCGSSNAPAGGGARSSRVRGPAEFTLRSTPAEHTRRCRSADQGWGIILASVCSRSSFCPQAGLSE